MYLKAIEITHLLSLSLTGNQLIFEILFEISLSILLNSRRETMNLFCEI